jgi:hypothetical protein
MKTVIFLAAVLTTTSLSAQSTVYIVESSVEPPLNEWYMLEREKDDAVFYMDFDNRESAEFQIDMSLSEMDADFDSGNLVDLGDGLLYLEWNGVWHDSEGNDVAAYFVYMFSNNNPNFHRISVQYSM